MPNPYDPQNPVKPLYFGGRRAMVDSFKERLNGAVREKQSGGVLIYGHRGVGKTSLLKKFMSVARGEEDHPSDVLIIYRRLSQSTNSDLLYNILLEEVASKIAERKNFFEKAKAFGKTISGVNLFNLGINIQHEKGTYSPYQVWKIALKSLSNVSCVMVAIDDADQLEITSLGELKTFMEEVTEIPIILTISGGVEFEEKLVDDYSPIARIFSGSSFNISRFEYDETKEVLNLPLDGESTSWDEEAMEALYRLTLGYPYLVQCLAKVSYRENQKITKEIVENSIEGAVDMGKAWLGHEIPTASDQDILSFLKIVELNKEVFQSVEISSKGVLSPYIGRLVKLKVLKQINRGRYKLEKSPIVAIYEKLKRGL